MNPDEEWRDIPGYEGTHQVSNLGRVRSLDHHYEVMGRWGMMTRFHKGRVLKGNYFRNEYHGVVLRAKDKCHLVHRLVGEVFLPNPSSLPEINHKDGIRHNNVVTNLEWATSRENKLHSYRELDRKQHAWTKPVALVRGSDRVEFPSEFAAAKHLGVDAGSIRSALKRDHLCRGWAVELLAA